MKNAVVNARMELELKSEVEAIFKQLGMNTTQAITMFFEQIRLHRAIPFQIKLPNEETMEAMEDALAGRNMETVSMEELISQAKSRVQ
jgi:DNA-damage-inducible protein J